MEEEVREENEEPMEEVEERYPRDTRKGMSKKFYDSSTVNSIFSLF